MQWSWGKIQYGHQKYISYYIFACESSPFTSLLYFGHLQQLLTFLGSHQNILCNIVTVDGTGTFHGMGIIAAVTPGTQAKKHIPKANVTAADIEAVGRINIRYFKNPPALPAPLTNLARVLLEAEDPTAQLDVLWKSSLFLHSPRSAWAGMMQRLHRQSVHEMLPYFAAAGHKLQSPHMYICKRLPCCPKHTLMSIINSRKSIM